MILLNGGKGILKLRFSKPGLYVGSATDDNESGISGILKVTHSRTDCEYPLGAAAVPLREPT